MRITTLTLLLLGCSTPVWADAGTTMAALPNEAAEARYLTQLCATATDEHAKFAAAMDSATSAEGARTHAPGSTTMDPAAFTAGTAIRAAEVHQELFTRALAALTQATDVAHAKRGHLPKGYHPCVIPGVAL